MRVSEVWKNLLGGEIRDFSDHGKAEPELGEISTLWMQCSFLSLLSSTHY